MCAVNIQRGSSCVLQSCLRCLHERPDLLWILGNAVRGGHATGHVNHPRASEADGLPTAITISGRPSLIPTVSTTTQDAPQCTQTLLLCSLSSNAGHVCRRSCTEQV